MELASINEWYKILIFIIVLFTLILFAEKLRSLLNWPTEVTRKFIHIITGVLIFFTPYFFKSAIPLIFISVLFILLNFIAIRFNLFKGMHGTERTTYGTVFYPVSFLVILLFFWPSNLIIIQMSMLILAVSDALAAIIGEKKTNPHKFNLIGEPKSYEGSTVMAVSSFLIIFVGLIFLSPTTVLNLTLFNIIWISLITAIIATVVETISISGSDNISVPLGVAFVLHFMFSHNITDNVHFTIGICFALIVALVSFYFQFLDKSGATSTFLLGTIIFGIGGWNWAIPILGFFFTSSLLSKMWKNQKKVSNLMYEKSSRRDFGQVIANGGFPAIAILLFYTTGNRNFYLIYLGAIAAVTADTWATEIGALSKKLPRLITNFKAVAPGTSGAISFIGTIGAFLGSLFIAIIGFLSQPDYFRNVIYDIFLISTAGLIACFVDSLMGVKIQSQYRCTICNKLSEKQVHCDNQPTSFERGLKWITNDVVNFFCGFTGTIYVFIFIQFLQ